ncbi:MAG: cysteine protease StiP family protein [Acidimicrobiales bacterium]
MTTTAVGFSGSYPAEDVTFLLKDLSGLMEESSLEEREQAMQGGGHYSERLPIEYEPTARYTDLFHTTLAAGASLVAYLTAVTAERILRARGDDPVLVSLARAGTPVGILLRRYLLARHGLDLAHYSVSIIRGRGIDERALAYVQDRHPGRPIQFIDGWSGKGAIQRELTAACRRLGLDDRMAVLADPGECTAIWGTRDDVLIPSACLNATVSGLVSRTVLNRLIGPGDFHGAKVYGHLAPVDLSNTFVDTVAAHFGSVGDIAVTDPTPAPTWAGWDAVRRIATRAGIDDVNLVKPGVGEATRVLLRRRPWKVLVRPDRTDDLEHVLVLAEERRVPVEPFADMTYSCCGLIAPL